MLREIERVLAERDLWTIEELAARLGVPRELVRAGLHHLVRLGRLPAGSTVPLGLCPAPQSCSGCALAGACGGRLTPS